MTTERAQELQVRITKEALALMVIHGESVSTAPSEEDVSVAHFEEAVTLIGKAWNLPAGIGAPHERHWHGDAGQRVGPLRDRRPDG